MSFHDISIADRPTKTAARDSLSSKHNSRTFPILLASFRSPTSEPLQDPAATRTPAGLIFHPSLHQLSHYISKNTPHTWYPFVWVVSRLNPLPERSGLYVWILELWGSITANAIPEDVAILYTNGKLHAFDPRLVRCGVAPRYDPTGHDLLPSLQAWIYHIPLSGVGGPSHAN